MKILTNKFFILGNLLLLLIAIPLTLYFVKKQQEVRSKAAPSSRLYFNPATANTSTQCQNFKIDVMLDPGSNFVSIVHFYITYDPTKLDITEITPSDIFKNVVTPASIAAGSADISVDAIGGDVTKSVSSIAKVATITFVPKATGTTEVKFDSEKSLVLQPDKEELSVLSTTSPGTVIIDNSTCLAGEGGTPTVTPGGASPTPTSGTLTPSPTVTNQAPVCTSLAVSPSATGSAPFSVLFTGQGNDPDSSGLITKATFTFGDGQTQDVTTGLNLKTVTTQASHTYQAAGTYPATVVFTDNQTAVSQACSKTITAQAASGSGTITPTVGPTVGVPPSSTPIPTSAPTIAPTGSIGQTVGIIGAVIMTIAIGFLLLAL